MLLVAATSSRVSRHPAAAWLLLVLSAGLYLGLAGAPALVDDDIDAAHALVAREMLERHDYVVMYQDGLRYLIRAPLHFWMIAASYAALGQSAFATRLPVALAMVGLVLLTFEFGRRFFGQRAGLYGGLAVATSAGMFVFTRTVIPEAIYALEFTAVFYLFLRSWTGSLAPGVGYRAAAAVCALAVLTRGPIGLLFPAATIVVFLTATQGWPRWRELRLPSSIALFLAIAAPWHVLAERRAPGFAWAYFVNEHVNRALGTRLPHDYGAVPLGLWLAEHAVWLFPWSAFAVLTVRLFPAPRSWGTRMDADAQARLLLFAWAAVIVGFFCLESGSRMEYYSFGAWPALALLLGLGIALAEDRGDRRLLWISRGLAVLGALYAAGTAIFLRAVARPAIPADITADLKTHGADFYQSAMAHVLDLTPQALADLRGPLILSAASLFAAFLASAILRQRRRHVAATVVIALGMVGVFVAANLSYRALEPSLSSRSLAMRINRDLRPEDRIALYGDIRMAPGIAFYSHRRVLLFHATESNLEFGSHFPDAPRTFYGDEDFRQLWAAPGRVLLVVPEDKDQEALQRLPAGSARVLAAAGGKTVYVNHGD
ncbi:MAG TPA: glycosyltransferase family 39 protein [Thermoanaerobaculia bacterium]|jgi:4-amino-4-deoxy-L-arabinose transferase-like glycosyltransferase|nr:glycosyltransferase family 39 protein [Thermoanaerobaculia bacterium]